MVKWYKVIATTLSVIRKHIYILVNNLILIFIYSMVLKLCDENDKAKDLNDYFKKTLQDHIANNILPILRKKRDYSLLQEFVR